MYFVHQVASQGLAVNNDRLAELLERIPGCSDRFQIWLMGLLISANERNSVPTRDRSKQVEGPLLNPPFGRPRKEVG
jgi:hypothetical protein